MLADASRCCRFHCYRGCRCQRPRRLRVAHHGASLSVGLPRHRLRQQQRQDLELVAAGARRVRDRELERAAAGHFGQEAEHDPLALDDVHAELFARLNTADKAWVVVPGGDHAAFMETPRDYFLDVMATFIRGDR